jgi:hypothetical protein
LKEKSEIRENEDSAVAGETMKIIQGEDCMRFRVQTATEIRETLHSVPVTRINAPPGSVLVNPGLGWIGIGGTSAGA